MTFSYKQAHEASIGKVVLKLTEDMEVMGELSAAEGVSKLHFVFDILCGSHYFDVNSINLYILLSSVAI